MSKRSNISSLFFLSILVPMSLLIFTISAEANTQPDLLINEIMANPLGSDAIGEWIELYNNSGQIIDIGDWSLNNSQLPAAQIEPKGYLILARDAAFISSEYNISLDKVVQADFQLTNSGSSLSLSNNLSTHTFIYSQTKEAISTELLSGECNIIQNHPESHSISHQNNLCPELITPSPTIPPTSTPTPTPTPTPITPTVVVFTPTPTVTNHPTTYPKLLINQIYPNPLSGERENFTIYNPGDATVNLNGWYVQDASPRKYMLEAVDLLAKAKLLVYPKSLSLNNPGDTLNLYSPDGVLQDSVSYGTSQKGQVFDFSTRSIQATPTNSTKPITIGESNVENLSLPVPQVEFTPMPQFVSENSSGNTPPLVQPKLYRAKELNQKR